MVGIGSGIRGADGPSVVMVGVSVSVGSVFVEVGLAMRVVAGGAGPILAVGYS